MRLFKAVVVTRTFFRDQKRVNAGWIWQVAVVIWALHSVEEIQE
jgi:hypothetical protein